MTAPRAAPPEDEYMCPNCVTPWKCNGPHIPQEVAPPEPNADVARIVSELREAGKHAPLRAGQLAWDAADLLESQAATIATLQRALRDMTTKCVSLVDSGDAGFWDAEKEPEVIAARAALVNEEPKKNDP